MDFVCPKCKGVLKIHENNVKKCSQNHSYDRAKQGYYNFLVGRGGIHGDNQDMVLARRKFLEFGYYAPLRERICDTVAGVMPKNGALLDLGAGEGYYTSKVEETLYQRDGRSNVLAFDISKVAMARLSSLNKRISAAVASSYDIPLPDESIDLGLNIFSPLAISETLRVLKRGGYFLMVFPDVMHLYGLKSAIYDKPYKNEPNDTKLDGFELIKDEALSYDVSLKGTEEISSLFMMTPYAYRTPPERRAAILSLETLTTEVAFRIVLYRKL